MLKLFNFMDCPFCNIDENRNPVLKDGKCVKVILSNPCLMPGHILIVPKRHVEKVSELRKEEWEEFFRAFIEFQEIVLKKIAPGCDIRQNYRPFQKQDRLKVNHLHFHLQPRHLFDKLYEKCQVSEKEVFKNLTQKELDKMVKIFSKQ